jgi:hypothetical protein
MSRGYGQVQRKIIETLREHAAEHAPSSRHPGMPLAEIVGDVYYVGPMPWRVSWYDRKETVAIRRALRSLVADGVVIDLGQFFGARRFCIHYAYAKR